VKTVDKAMHLLNRFSIEQTEIGLSELARLADLDKAATRRLLVALAKHGYIEQSADTRKYRLGPTPCPSAATSSTSFRPNPCPFTPLPPATPTLPPPPPKHSNTR